jgi:hypothetical protein
MATATADPPPSAKDDNQKSNNNSNSNSNGKSNDSRRWQPQVLRLRRSQNARTASLRMTWL